MALPQLTTQERQEIAEKLGTSRDTVYMWLTGRRLPSANVARKLNDADKRLKLEDLRPLDHAQLWPEIFSPKKRKV